MTSAAASSQPPTFDTLPVEILRRIISLAAPREALTLSYVNRKLYNVCNDSLVYKAIVDNHIASSSANWAGLPFPVDSSPALWARYAVAVSDAASRRDYSEASQLDRFMTYAPLLVAVHHPFFAQPSSSTDFINAYSDDYRTCEPRTQAYYFCLSACLLSVSQLSSPEYGRLLLAPGHRAILAAQINANLVGGLDEVRRSRMNTVQYATAPVPENAIEVVASQLGQFSPQEIREIEDMRLRSQFVRLKHILANGAVGPMTYALRRALVGNRLSHRSHNSLPHIYPPTLTNIPFHAFMKLPPPFSPSAAEDFATCHLGDMATPDFLQDGEWVGYYAYSAHSVGVGVSFDSAARGISFDVDDGDGVLNLSAVGAADAIGSFSLQGSIEVRTGVVTLSKVYNDGLGWLQEGMLTPFGIVGSWGTAGWGGWFWYWKAAWSGPAR